MDDMTDAAQLLALHLIAELDREVKAKRHLFGIIVVVFPDGLEALVKSDDPGRLQRLADEVRAGGTPIGIIAANPESGTIVDVTSWVYPEYGQEEETGERLGRLTDYVAKLVAEQGGGSILTPGLESSRPL